jgi:hypothetical protein
MNATAGPGGRADHSTATGASRRTTPQSGAGEAEPLGPLPDASLAFVEAIGAIPGAVGRLRQAPGTTPPAVSRWRPVAPIAAPTARHPCPRLRMRASRRIGASRLDRPVRKLGLLVWDSRCHLLPSLLPGCKTPVARCWNQTTCGKCARSPQTTGRGRICWKSACCSLNPSRRGPWAGSKST